MTGFIHAQIKNPTRSLKLVNKLAATVTTMHEILAKDTGGVVIPATSSTVRSEIVGICNQDIAAAEVLTQVPVIEIFGNDTFVVDVTNNSDVAHDGQRMVLTDSLTVNNTGTDDVDGVIEQVEPYGLAAEKKILCKFV